MAVNKAELKMLKQSIANLNYLIEKAPESNNKESYREQRGRCEDRLAELEAAKSANKI
jgi:hypothetical protein